MKPALGDQKILADVDRRLTLAFGALILALLLAVLLAGGFYLRGVMEREENKLSTTLTGVLANAVSHVSFSGKYHARLLLQEIQAQQPGISYLLIADSTGRILAHGNATSNDAQLDADAYRVVQEVLRQGRSQSRLISLDGKPVREITFPYRGGYGNALLGVIQVGLSEQSRDAALANGLIYVAAVLAGLLAIGVSITLRISRHFGDPVKHLANDMSATLQAIPDPLFELDGDGRYLQVLTPKQELLAAPREQLLNHTIREVLPAEAAATVFRGLEEAAVQGESHGQQFMLRLPQGVCWFELSIARKEGGQPGQSMRFIVLSRDITERKRVEEELRRLNETLEQRVKDEVAKNRDKDHLLIQQSRLAAMGEMVHNIAHQWRQPLNALSLIVTNIKDDFDYRQLTQETLERDVAKARALLQGMSTTIDDFRDFFRPDLEPGDFELGNAVEEALFVMAAALKNSNIEVVKDLPRGLRINGFPNQFAQVVLNILANAKEAIQQGKLAAGRIGITLAKAGGDGVLSIEDNAGGIPVDVLPRIFDPYFTTKEQGSGIGLYMSKMIVERNFKGRINAANSAAGALVTITLPLLDETALARKKMPS